jgi:two-component system chemotaxis response regulator CheY
VNSRPYAETVLVVDDTEFMVKVLADIFTGDGFEVVTAANGEEALRLYEEHLPDLVTLDVVMPGMDGIAVLQRLREIDPAAKVVMVSAVGLEAKVMEAFRVGARNYVLKPFERDRVLEAVRKVLDEY